jgi:hypothetical protein
LGAREPWPEPLVPPLPGCPQFPQSGVLAQWRGAMNNSKDFRELNLPVLRRLAHEWAEEYPIIDKLLLFQGRKRVSSKYFLVAIVPHINDLENAPERFFESVANHYQMPLEQFSFCEIYTIMGRILHLMNNTWENCLHIREDLMDVYHPPINESDFRYVDEWCCYNEESIDGAKRLLYEFVVPESLCVLYGKEVAEKKSDAAIEEIPTGVEFQEYVFRQEGPTWMIMYEGKTLRGLKGRGFRHIHFLVSQPRKEFTAYELMQELDGYNPEETTKDLSFIDLSTKEPIKGKEFLGVNEIIDEKAMEDFKRHRRSLVEELEDAVNCNDLERRARAQEELKDFDEQMISYMGKGGKGRKFVNNRQRTITTISKRIRRAVDSLEEHNKEIHRHFKKALFPVSEPFSYNPDRNVPWLTE